MKKKQRYIKEYTPDSWQDAKKILFDIATKHKEIYFRGQSNEKWHLISSFQRQIDLLVKNKMLKSTGIKDSANILENELLKRFENSYSRIPGAMELPERDEQGNFNNEYIAICQHYNLPTRLLDWSTSPYIASFFAFDGHKTSATPEGRKVAVWAIDWEMFEFFIYWNYKHMEFPTDSGTPRDLCNVLELCRRNNHPRIDIVKTKGNKNRRIIYQQGIFTKAIKVEDDIEEYLKKREKHICGIILHKVVIPGNQRTCALADLYLMSITPVVLMNDPDGAAATAFNEVIKFYLD